MKQVLKIEFPQFAWQKHPHLAGVATRFMDVGIDRHAAIDAQIARLDPSELIPWHVHEQHGEIAFVISGSGLLFHGSPESHQQETMYPHAAFFIAAGMWHSVKNVGAEPLMIFAVHTDQIERT